MARAIIASAQLIIRRGYSTAAAATASTSATRKAAPSKGLKAVDSAASSSSGSPSAYSGSSSWVPDPLTGYYRPTNQSGDAAAAAATLDSLLSKQHN